MSRFEIKLFGAIEISRDSQPVTQFRSQKALAILAFLITEARPVMREYLAGLAWPEATQTQALGLLRRSLHSLSKQLPDCLAISQRTISIKQDAPAQIDTRQFAQFAAQPDPSAWITAIDLYRAPFLEGVYLSDCPVFEQWLITVQKRWQTQVDGLLTRLIQTLIDQGDYRTALAYAERRLALAPWQEETHQQLMRLLLYNGQRNAALAQYERCVAVLADELGVEPSPDTQTLYEQIKQAQPYPPYNLPPQVMPFLGRQSELTDLTRMIANPAQRLITLLGPGGIGKTRLAIALAQRQLGRPTNQPDPDAPTYAYFTHGIYLVSLTAVETASGLVPNMADALNFRLDTDHAKARPPKQQLVDYLRQKRLLLIVDNFEQLLNANEGSAATGLLLEIVQAAPEVKLLVTTRERLQIRGEQVYPILGLAYPNLAGNGEIDEGDYPAIALFNQIAQHLQPDFRCTGETAISVAQICSILQGMPLAIELAAATINILTPAEILTELTHSLDLLTTTTRHIPARHRSIRAAFETSWQQLSPAEQTCFQQLSVFRGGFTREAAQAVASASRIVLAGLANKSFTHFHQETQRYEIHELMRQFGAEQLGQSAELEKQTRQQYSQFYATKLAQWSLYVKGPQQQTTLQAMMDDSQNFHLAWQSMVAHRQHTLLAQAIDGLGIFYQWQGWYREGIDLFESCCQVLRSIGEGALNTVETLIKALAWQGIFEHNLGHTKAAIRLCKEALAYDKSQQFQESLPQSYRRAQAFLWQILGQVLFNQSRSEAKEYVTQSLAIYESLDDEWGLAQSYFRLGQIAREFGDYPTAKKLIQRSLNFLQDLDDRRGIADRLGWLGLIAMDMGDLDQAEEFGQQKLAYYRSLNNLPGIASSLEGSGLLDLFMGSNVSAENKFQESLVIYSDLGDQQKLGNTHIWLGIARCMQGRYSQAISNGEKALSLSDSMGNLWAMGHSHTLLGYLHLVLNQVDDARAHLQTSVELFQKLGQQDELSQALAWMIYVELARHEIVSARAYLTQCLDIVLEVRTILPLLEALPAIAKFLCLQEEIELAVEIYALTRTSPMLANAALIQDLIGSFMDAITKPLPPDVVAAAQERGRQRDLWETAAELLAQFTDRAR